MAQSGFHGLVGLGAARAVFARVPVVARTAFVVGTVLGAVIPDIDMYPTAIAVLLSPAGQAQNVAYEWHRTATHSVAFLLVLYLIGLFAYSKPAVRWVFWGLALGVATHEVLDILFWFAQIDLMWPFSILPHGNAYFQIVNVWPKPGAQSDSLIPNIRDAFEFAAFGLFLISLRRIASFQSDLREKIRSQSKVEYAVWAYFLVALVTAFTFRNDYATQQKVVFVPWLLFLAPYAWYRIWVYRTAIVSWAERAQQSWVDWGRTVGCSPSHILFPESEEEVAEIVRKARSRGAKVRVVGAGHSWSPVVTTDGIIVSLDNLKFEHQIDKVKKTATIHGGMRLRDIGPLLISHGLTFRNLGAITPQSISGAMSTGTHGTGLEFGVIGTQVIAMRVVDGLGKIQDINETEHPELMAAHRLGLGCLGIIVRVTLQCVDDYSVVLSQDSMSFDDFLTKVTTLPIGKPNHRVRAYWFPDSDKVLVQTMEEVPGSPQIKGSVYSFVEAALIRFVMMGFVWWLGRTFHAWISPCNRIIEAFGYGKSSKKSGHCFYSITTPIPPVHQEAEVAIPLANAVEALREYKRITSKHKVNVQSEIRFTGGDDILLSPGNKGNEKEFCYIGGYTATYIPNDPFFDQFCDRLSNFGAIPHWGKLDAPNRVRAQKYYGAKFDEFSQIRAEMDPDAVFANEYIQELFDLVH